MPPVKQPSALFTICTKSCAKVIADAYRALCKKYGSWESEECVNAMHQTQEYLLSNPRFCNFLDMLRNRFPPERCYYESRDSRVFYLLQKHKGMRELYCDINYDCNGLFWEELLCNANYVHYVKLQVCSDHIIKIISENCPNLKFVKFFNDSEFYEADVSDSGILYLERCTKLKVIEVHIPSITLTVSVVARLVINLQNLEKISYKNMGLVLLKVNSKVNSLTLKSIRLRVPDKSQIYVASKLCTKLQTLHIDLCLDCVEDQSTHICNALMNSSFQVPCLELDTFFNGPFIELLQVKGQFITSFTLGVITVTEDVGYAVGTYCPNIVHLYLRDNGAYRDEVNKVEFKCDSNVVLFSKLETLEVYKFNVNHVNILLVLLSNAKRLKKFECCVNFNDNLDETMKEIFKKNPLENLTEFCGDMKLGMETITYLFNCPRITRLTFVDHLDITPDFKLTLSNNISQNNLDVEVNWY